MRLKLISCEIFYREVCSTAARSVNQIDVEFLPKGLHDLGSESMLTRIQQQVDQASATDYEAVLLGYALCGNGVSGLKAKSQPLVIPRAHDCIAVFLGSSRRYEEYFREHPGTYFKTSGWIERGDGLNQLSRELVRKKTGLGYSYEELVSRYGEDNAQYLFEQLGNSTRHYSRMTFIEMGVEPDDRFERQTRESARERRLQFDKLQGDLSLLQRMMDGHWNRPEFLIVPPGRRVVASYDEQILKLE